MRMFSIMSFSKDARKHNSANPIGWKRINYRRTFYPNVKTVMNYMRPTVHLVDLWRRRNQIPALSIFLKSHLDNSPYDFFIIKIKTNKTIHFFPKTDFQCITQACENVTIVPVNRHAFNRHSNEAACATANSFATGAVSRLPSTLVLVIVTAAWMLHSLLSSQRQYCWIRSGKECAKAPVVWPSRRRAWKPSGWNVICRLGLLGN